MSLSYSDKSVIGGPFDTGVTTQLNRRKKIISKVNTRGPEDIKYLTSNTGWVRVMSSVNTVEDGNKTAKSSILLGGTLNAINGLSNSLVGFDPTDINSTYNKSSTYGYTPKAGITSFQVQSKGTFGTLRTASFNFTVSSPEEFSKLEQLYLRPGFSILLEWGHTYFISNNEDTGLSPMRNLFDINSFMTQKTDIAIEKSLENLKSGSNSYNYDAMFGIIKNFIWSYNGYTYECQVDVVSKGEIVESVEAAMSPLVQIGENKENTDTKYTPYGSELEAFLKLIANSRTYAQGEKDTPKIIDYLKSQNETLTESLISEHGKVNRELKILTTVETHYPVSSKGSTKYITLRTLLILLNEINMVCSSDNENTLRFHIGEDNIKNTFVTFSEHIGLDPSICILPKIGTTLNNFYFFDRTPSEDRDNILDIFISVNFILDSLEEMRTKQDTETTIVDFLLFKILNRVQNNLGEINKFDLHKDIKGGITYLHVIDRSVIPDKKKLKTKLDLVGLSSEVSNLNIASKLSSRLTSMIAIAAQDVYSPSSSEDLFNIQKWNVGLNDRHLRGLKVGKKANPSTTTNPETGTKIDPTEVTNQELKKQLQDYINDIVNLINPTIDPTTFQEIPLPPGLALPDPTGLESVHKQVMKEYVRVYTTKDKTNPPGLIPFELSFTIKGISGIKVGQAFTINDFFLPQRYKGNVGFIVTGIDHTVADNKWTTEIKSQMIFL